MRLIDADALKKLVKEFRDDAPQSSIRRYVCNVILSMLGDENQTPTIEAGPKWISVKDRLPAYNRTVLTYSPDMAQTMLVDEYAGYYGEDDDEWYEGWVHRKGVTHWMPLPEPPKED